jgi:DNA polymerase
MHDANRAAELTALLDWYRGAGVDEAVGETAIDWLAKGNAAPGNGFAAMPPAGLAAGLATGAAAPPPQRAPAPSRPDPGQPPPRLPAPASAPAAPPRLPAAQPRQFTATPPDAAVMAARTAARQAATLDDLAATLAGFDGCALKATAKNLCFYRGAPKALVMLIGEAPGRDEDLEGKPFVGRAGQLLDKMLASIGLDESQVHITNIVYWRPPGNRTPTPQEAQVCRPFLERQVELVAPEMVVLLGGAAAKHVLDVAEGIMRTRGKWRDIEISTARVRVLATLHPAYLLRTPAGKRLAWRDLLAIRAELDVES